jgi:20S proteasome alpha/beta subunit
MTATKEHVISLAEYIISETGTQDPKVGGPIGIALITADDGYRELDESEVADVHQKNQEELHKFREHFAGR